MDRRVKWGERALVFCEAQSVSPDELVVFEIHYADRVGENYFAKALPVPALPTLCPRCRCVPTAVVPERVFTARRSRRTSA